MQCIATLSFLYLYLFCFVFVRIVWCASHVAFFSTTFRKEFVPNSVHVLYVIIGSFSSFTFIMFAMWSCFDTYYKPCCPCQQHSLKPNNILYTHASIHINTNFTFTSITSLTELSLTHYTQDVAGVPLLRLDFGSYRNVALLPISTPYCCRMGAASGAAAGTQQHEPLGIMRVALQAAQGRGLVAVPLSALVWSTVEGGAAGKSQYLLQHLMQATSSLGQRQGSAPLDEGLMSSLVMGWQPLDGVEGLEPTHDAATQSAASVVSGVFTETAAMNKLVVMQGLVSTADMGKPHNADVLKEPNGGAPDTTHLSKLLNSLQLSNAAPPHQGTAQDAMRAVQQLLMSAAPGNVGVQMADQSTSSSSQGMVLASPFAEQLPGVADSVGGCEVERMGSGSAALYAPSQFGGGSDAGNSDMLLRALHSNGGFVTRCCDEVLKRCCSWWDECLMVHQGGSV